MYKDEYIGTIRDGIEIINIPRKWFTKTKCPDKNEQVYQDYKKWLFSPWSSTSVYYQLVPQEDGTWCCTYTSIVFDDAEVTFFEYASDPNAALKKCQTNLLKTKMGVYD